MIIRPVLVVLAVLAAGACTSRFQPAGPTVTQPSIAGETFIAPDGARLPVRRWAPKGAVKSVIVGLHGFNDYSNAFDRPARFWAAQGILTYAYDQRGFGAAPHPGLWAGTATLTSDLAAFIRAARARHPGKPIHLVGVSMGGAVALAALAGASPPAVDGVVLVAPAVWGRRNMTVFSRSLLWIMSNTMPGFTLTGEGLNIQPSDNIEMLRALGRDEKVIKRTRVDAIKGLVDLMDVAFDSAKRITGPALFLYGERDEIVPRDATFDALKALRGKKNARVALYPDGFHMLLRDLQAKKVLADVVAWTGNSAAALPSGAERKIDDLAAAE